MGISGGNIFIFANDNIDISPKVKKVLDINFTYLELIEDVSSSNSKDRLYKIKIFRRQSCCELQFKDNSTFREWLDALD